MPVYLRYATNWEIAQAKARAQRRHARWIWAERVLLGLALALVLFLLGVHVGRTLVQ